MSLIDEALKRAQEASQRGAGEKARSGRGRRLLCRTRASRGAAPRVRLGLRTPRRGRRRGRAGFPGAPRSGMPRRPPAPAPAGRRRRGSRSRQRFRRFPRPSCPRPTRRRRPSRPPGLRRLPVPTSRDSPDRGRLCQASIEVPPPASTLDDGRTYVGSCIFRTARRSSSAESSGPRKSPAPCSTTASSRSAPRSRGSPSRRSRRTASSLEKDGIDDLPAP